MRRRASLAVGGATLAILAASLTTMPGSASAATAMSAPPPVVTIAVSGNQATISQPTIRPGIVEFHVGRTFPLPEEVGGGSDPLSIVRTDQLDDVLAQLQAVFTADPSDPASMAASAAGMRAVHAMTTLYGGSVKGGVWQVNLPVGNYYVLGVQSTVMGMAKPVPFTVAGTPRTGSLHATQMTIRAVGPVGTNTWTFRQRSGPVTWINFANASHELHFLDLTGVTPNTTGSMVKKAFMSDGPPKFDIGPNISFDVISPGVRVAIKQDVNPGKYLVSCFIPSEVDGMPHALMGMWKLITVM